MSDDAPVLVQEEQTGNFGVYYPEDDAILTYIGNEQEEIHGAYLGENWHDAEEGELTASIEADIQDVREDVEELREQDLTEEQRDELERLESRLESQENVLELHKEVQDA